MNLRDELRELAHSTKKREGSQFMLDNIKSIEGAMRKEAEKGLYQLKIGEADILNVKDWLSEPHLYSPIIERLKNEGFEVVHSDDLRDGTYIIIKW